MNLIVSFLAQTTAPTTSGGAPPPPLFNLFSGPMMPLILGIAVLYFFMFRSKNTEKKHRESMLSALKKGDRVQTIGGILGTVIEAREGDVLVKVDESSNTKMRFVRSAIHRVVVDDDKAESK